MSGSNHTLNLILAILATIFCCMPLGIVAIVFSAIGMSRQGAGDHAGAESAARTARICIWVSVGLSLAIWIIYLVIFVALLGVAVLPFLALA